MKRSVVFLVSITLFFTTACQPRTTLSQKNEFSSLDAPQALTSSATSTTSNPFLPEEVGIVTEGKFLLEVNNPYAVDSTKENPRLDSPTFIGEDLLWTKSYESGSNNTSYYTIYNIQSGKFNDFNVSIPDFSVGSGSSVLMQHRFLYYTDYLDGDVPLLKMMKVDLQDMTITIVASRENKKDEIELRPFVYLAKLNDHEFAIYSTFFEKVHNTQNYSIQKYDCDTNTSTELIHTSMRIDPTTGACDGDSIEQICVAEGNIYALCTNNNEDYSLNMYDAEGKFLSNMAVPEIKSFLCVSPLSIKIIGQYLFLGNWNMDHIVYKMNGKHLEVIANQDAGIFPEMSSVYGNKNPYIYSFVSTGDTMSIYIFEINTGKFKHIGFDLDPDYKRVSNITQSESGNLLVAVQLGDGDTGEELNRCRYYYVKAETIQKLLENS